MLVLVADQIAAYIARFGFRLYPLHQHYQHHQHHEQKQPISESDLNKQYRFLPKMAFKLLPVFAYIAIVGAVIADPSKMISKDISNGAPTSRDAADRAYYGHHHKSKYYSKQIKHEKYW